MEIWEPKPPGTLWATPGLLRNSFTCIRIILVTIPVAAVSKAWVCDPLLGGIAGSNQAGGLDVCFL